MQDFDPRQFIMQMIQKNRKFLFWESIAFIILGILALSAPVMFSFALELFLGWLCILSACVIGARVAMTRDLPNKSSNIMTMMVYLALGLILISYPLTGVLTLNLLLACFFVFDGIFKLTSALQIRPASGWGWLFFSSILSFFLAILIIMAFPTGSAWILGVFFGINFLFSGFVQLSLLWALPKQ